MSFEATVRFHAPRHPCPDRSGVPARCPRCGCAMEHALREVRLVLLLGDGAEVEVTSHECRRCGWCCTPEA